MCVDLIRSAYVVNMRFFAGSDLEIPVLWYRCSPNAKWFPHYNVFSSRNWDATKDYDHGQLGEVPGSVRPWNRGIRPPIYDGQSFYGDPQWYVTGVPPGAVSNTSTTCVLDSDPCACSSAIAFILPLFTRDSDPCACSSADSSLVISYIEDSDPCACSSAWSELYIDYIYDTFACSCSSAWATLDWNLDSDPCACSAVDSSILAPGYLFDGQACACSTLEATPAFPVSLSCACSTLEATPAFPVSLSCACSTVDSTHVP